MDSVSPVRSPILDYLKRTFGCRYCFNVGIEAGQLGVIALLSIAAWVLSRVSMQGLFYRSAGWLMGCLATFWTIDRTVLLF